MSEDRSHRAGSGQITRKRIRGPLEYFGRQHPGLVMHTDDVYAGLGAGFLRKSVGSGLARAAADEKSGWRREGMDTYVYSPLPGIKTAKPESATAGEAELPVTMKKGDVLEVIAVMDSGNILALGQDGLAYACKVVKNL